MKIRIALCVGALGLFAPGIVQAAGGPPIAYVKNGGSPEIYLVNSNGSGVTRVYTGARKSTVRWIDLKPGGNQVAFMQGLTVRIQKFFDNGQPDGTSQTVPAPCSSTQSPDFHPSGDGRIVYIAACGFGNFHVLTYRLGDVAPTSLFIVPSANRIRWSRTGDYLIHDQADSSTSGTMRLKRRHVATGTVEDFGVIGDLATFDVSRTGDRLAFGSVQSPKLLDFSTMTDTSQATALCAGDDIHFSPDDGQQVYETPAARGGTYILIRNASCSGSPNALTGKGNWGSKDWRPDPI